MVAPTRRDVLALAQAGHVLDRPEFEDDRGQRRRRADDGDQQQRPLVLVLLGGVGAQAVARRARSIMTAIRARNSQQPTFQAISARVAVRIWPGDGEIDDDHRRDAGDQTDAPRRRRGRSIPRQRLGAD